MRWTAKPTSKVEVGDSCQVHQDSVGLKHLTEICSKKVDGVLGYWQSGQVKFVTEGIVLPDPCPVGGGHWRGHSSVEEVSGDLLELCQLLRLWCGELVCLRGEGNET